MVNLLCCSSVKHRDGVTVRVCTVLKCSGRDILDPRCQQVGLVLSPSRQVDPLPSVDGDCSTPSAQVAKEAANFFCLPPELIFYIYIYV